MGQRTIIVLIAIGLMVSPIGVDASEDQWPDDCEGGEILDAEGVYNGTIDTPQDTDAIKFRLEEGEYLSMSILVPGESGEFVIRQMGDIYASARNGTNVTNENEYVYPTGGVPGSIQYWWEEKGVMCFYLTDYDPQNADVPYEWRISTSKTNPEPALTQISNSEQMLEDKNQTIQELENEIENLQNNSSGNVSIEVEVTPSGNQSKFVSGSKANVQVSSSEANLSEFKVKYGPGIYPLNSSGEVQIPLVETGNHTMTFQYQGTTENVTIHVESSPGSANELSLLPVGT